MKERWLYGLDFAQIGSLKELNDLMSEYIRRHNTTVHSVTKEAPLTRYTKTNDRVRKPKSVFRLSVQSPENGLMSVSAIA